MRFSYVVILNEINNGDSKLRVTNDGLINSMLYCVSSISIIRENQGKRFCYRFSPDIIIVSRYEDPVTRELQVVDWKLD